MELFCINHFLHLSHLILADLLSLLTLELAHFFCGPTIIKLVLNFPNIFLKLSFECLCLLIVYDELMYPILNHYQTKQSIIYY